MRLQQEAERNRVRSILYHALAEERRIPDTAEKERQIADLKERATPALRPILEQLEAEVEEAKARGGLGTLSWKEAIDRLKGDKSLHRMRKYFHETSYISNDPDQFANFCLYREFFRRPRRMNSAETMGLISLRYPALEGKKAPHGWPLAQEDWPLFLKLVIDFFVRTASAVNIDDKYLRWMGIPRAQGVHSGTRFPRFPDEQSAALACGPARTAACPDTPAPAGGRRIGRLDVQQRQDQRSVRSCMGMATPALSGRRGWIPAKARRTDSIQRSIDRRSLPIHRSRPRHDAEWLVPLPPGARRAREMSKLFSATGTQTLLARLCRWPCRPGRNSQLVGDGSGCPTSPEPWRLVKFERPHRRKCALLRGRRTFRTAQRNPTSNARTTIQGRKAERAQPAQRRWRWGSTSGVCRR